MPTAIRKGFIAAGSFFIGWLNLIGLERLAWGFSGRAKVLSCNSMLLRGLCHAAFLEIFSDNRDLRRGRFSTFYFQNSTFNAASRQNALGLEPAANLECVEGRNGIAWMTIADPDLSAASAPALQSILQALSEMEARLRALDTQIETLSAQNVDPQTQALVKTIPGFGPTIAAKVLAYLPHQILHAGSRRQAAARLQAFMGNDPRLQESGQWKGQSKMSKRGVETLRTAFFQAAFSASQHDPELRVFYQRKRAQGKCHQLALSHLMRILTRRLVAVLRSQQPYRSNYQSELKNAA
jgi:transposase